MYQVANVIDKAICISFQMEEFFLFAGLMFFTLILFTVMAYYYKYVEPRENEEELETNDTKAVEAMSNGYHKKVENGLTNDSFTEDEITQF